ncbi:UNVERIFIED_CONTAM: CPBP family intramembrane metalloprotease [Streptococcus canis]|uniref:CPBP family glutamic-type intramembrane protease n=1 Tax=Streptococcus canis TaxID=1329 RepID=UPI003D346957
MALVQTNRKTFFYFASGLVFAVVYNRTERLAFNTALHAMTNLITLMLIELMISESVG